MLIISLAPLRVDCGHHRWAGDGGGLGTGLGLLNFPLGTVLAIYGLWVPLARATARLFTTTTPTAAP